MTGPLLPSDLLEAMREAHPVSEPNPSRPWKRPGYGLGLMSGIASSGHKVMGHTGAGPGSVIAVYHRPDAAPPMTASNSKSIPLCDFRPRFAFRVGEVALI
jgi:hypothetical protein